MVMNIHYPLDFDQRGRTASCGGDEHIREMIEQVLFTNPGERVNRPDFGCGVLQLLFAPNGDQLTAAMQVSIQAALQRWLGDVIEVQTLEVSNDDSQLQIILAYIVTRTGQLMVETFERRGIA